MQQIRKTLMMKFTKNSFPYVLLKPNLNIYVNEDMKSEL